MIKHILLLTLIILVTCSVTSWWWLVVLAPFQYILLAKSITFGKSILISFLSGFIVFGVYSFLIDQNYSNEVSNLIASMFGEIPSWSSYIIAGLMGAISAALGGTTGYLGRKLWRK